MSIKEIMRGMYRVLLWLSLAFALLILLLFVTLQLPVTKQYLAEKAVEQVASLTNHRIEIGEVEISWFDHAGVRELRLFDYQDSLMLKVDRLVVNFRVGSLWNAGVLQLDELLIEDGKLELINYQDSSRLNLLVFLDDLKKGKSASTETPLVLELNEVTWKDFILSYSNENRLPKGEGILDLSHFDFVINDGFFRDFEFHSDTIQTEIVRFKGTENNTGLEIERFRSAFFLDYQHLTFSRLLLKTAHSQIEDSVAFNFNQLGALNYFADSVNMNLRLRGSKLSGEDLRYFGVKPSEKLELIAGADISGTLSLLSIEDFSVNTDYDSQFIGDATFFGLPSLANTFIDMQVKSGVLKASDVLRLVDKYTFQDDIEVKGNFLGFLKDFVANGTFQTQHGRVDTDLNFKVPTTINEAQYSGNLRLSSFDLGRATGTESIGTIDLQGNINGKGITKNTADFFVKAAGQNIYLNGYKYDSAVMEGQFASRFFDGSFQVRDPHCQLSGTTKIDFARQEEIMQVEATVDSLHLKPLNFSEQELNIVSQIHLDTRNLDFDNITGEVILDSTIIANDHGRKQFRNLRILASHQEKERRYALSSDEANVELKGVFTPSVLFKDFPKIVESYLHLLTTDLEDSLLLEPIFELDTLDAYSWDLNVDFEEINSILELLNLPLAVSSGSHFESSFTRRKNANFSLYAELDSLRLRENLFFK